MAKEPLSSAKVCRQGVILIVNVLELSVRRVKNMKFNLAGFNLTGGKYFAGVAVGAFAVGTLAFVNGCSQSDRSTGAREEVIAQNASEAEAAEEKLAAEQASTHSKTHHVAQAIHKKEGHEAHRRPASVAGGVYVVQVGAFKIKENAEKLQEKLNSAGYHVEMQTMNHSRNGLLHLVRSLPTANRAEAETMLEDLHAKHDMQAQIVTVPTTETH